ncbi:hypothetical protein [Massilia sp. 9096]|uniref:hypothetical protein n=1 Tax=Massilia sp. 9096 TaxID=1500894 RepID=UPI00056B43F8|nr:hypothetical protein [Massilia sp. 9096]
MNAARTSAAFAAAGAASIVRAAPSSGAPLQRTREYVAMNPHIKYGRSDKRGYMFLEITPRETRARFMGLDEVHDPHTAQRELAAFRVADGKPGVEV